MTGPDNHDAERRVRDSFARMQVMTTIGASLRRVAAGEVEIELPFLASLTQQHGFVHAGILATILDTACGYAALTLMPKEAAVLTTEFKINFLSPAMGDRLVAAGHVVRPGRKLMVCLGDVFAEKGESRSQVALMTASMIVVDVTTRLRD
jgi:uncharacterized protein (TIGR00369 family)